MTQDILLIVVLYVASLALIVMEICTPFFGLLSVMSLAALIGAIYFCYSVSQLVGVVATVASILGYPVFIIAAVKIIPRTGLGRRLVLSRQQTPPGEGTPGTDAAKSLLGKQGVAETLLRPSGAVRIDGQRIMASAETSTIEKGSAVKVIRVTGNEVVVRRIE